MSTPIPSNAAVRLKPIRDWRVWLATGLGVGRVAFAPGTVGSLWGPPLVVGLLLIGVTGLWLLPVVAVLFLVGVPLCEAGAKHFERKDPPWVVFDEIAVYPILYVLTPLTVSTGVIGFLLFRCFDIVKPWPIKRFEKLPGGWGIMIDDLIAAIHAMIILRLLMAIFPAI